MITCSRPVTQHISSTHIPKMLIVDDEFLNRALLERLFQGHFQVINAENGVMALELLSQHEFDIVLLDIMMPGISGLNVLTQIRKTPQLADLPVIMVSALSDNDSIIEGLRLGANDYVAKPVDVDVLMARVQTQATLKRLLDERKQHIRQLEEAQKFKDQFFQMASHDLKGPLGNIRMAHVLVRDAVEDNPLVADVLNLAEGAVDHMQHMIEEFLDMAAIQSGRLKVNLQEVFVDDVIYNLVEEYRLSAGEKNIEIVSLLGETCILADRMLFTQSLGNLVSNAVKYSPFNTQIRIWTEQRGEVVRVCVSDQGPGVPEQERGRLFTQFGKLKARPTNGESSTGLGLWIVKAQTDAQKGHVGVDCPPEGGSVFWLEMPAS